MALIDHLPFLSQTDFLSISHLSSFHLLPRDGIITTQSSLS